MKKAFLLLALSLLFPVSARAAWVDGILVPAPEFGDWKPSHALVVMPDGTVRVAFGGDHLYLASGPAEGPWDIRVIDDSEKVGAYTSMARSAGGDLAISYRDEPNHALKAARRSGASWIVETVDSDADVGAWTSVVDYGGGILVAYADQTNYNLKAARWTGAWTTETVQAGAGGANSAAAATDGVVYVATQSFSPAGVRVHRWDGAWQAEDVEMGSGLGSSLCIAVDAGNVPYVAYRDDNATSLKLATRIGPSWTVQTVDNSADVGQYPSCVFDQGGLMAIAYFRSDTGDLLLARGNPAAHTWTRWPLEETLWTGFETNIAVLADNRYAVAYKMGTLEMIKVGIFNPTAETFDADMLVWTGDSGKSADITASSTGYLHLAWTDQEQGMVSVGIWTPEGEFSSAEVAASDSGVDFSTVVSLGGDPGVLYYDEETLSLMAALPGSPDYVIETVDDSADVGGYASAAASPGGAIHVAYLDWDNDALKYATNAGGSWAAETIEAGSCGYYASLAIEPVSGAPHIAYYDFSGEDLKHAWKDGLGNWQTEFVDTENDVGAFASLKFKASGEAAVAYLDWTAGNLKYAVQCEADWCPSVADASGHVGGEIGLAFAPDGAAYIALRDETLGGSAVVSNAGGSWARVHENSGIDRGYNHRVAIDDGGHPVVVSYDAANGDLRYARFTDDTTDDDTADDDSADDSADDTGSDDDTEVPDDDLSDDVGDDSAATDDDIHASDDDDGGGGCCG